MPSCCQCCLQLQVSFLAQLSPFGLRKRLWLSLLPELTSSVSEFVVMVCILRIDNTTSLRSSLTWLLLKKSCVEAVAVVVKIMATLIHIDCCANHIPPACASLASNITCMPLLTAVASARHLYTQPLFLACCGACSANIAPSCTSKAASRSESNRSALCYYCRG